MSGERGPESKSKSELKKTNTWRQKNAPVESEGGAMETPVSGRGIETPPSWLTKAEVKIWKEFLPKAIEMKTYQNADHFSFGLFCRAACDLLDAQRALKSEGVVYDGTFFSKDGAKQTVPKKHPLVDVERVKRDTFLKFSDQFGFNPMARTRLKIVPFVKKPQPSVADLDADPIDDGEFMDMMGIDKTK